MYIFLASYILWLYPVFEAWETQYNVKPRFTPSCDLLRCSNYSIATLACMVSRSITQWKHLFMDWRPPSLPSYRLMKCGIDLKSQRNICPFLSYNPGSSLTGRRPSYLPGGGSAVSTVFEPLYLPILLTILIVLFSCHTVCVQLQILLHFLPFMVSWCCNFIGQQWISAYIDIN